MSLTSFVKEAWDMHNVYGSDRLVSCPHPQSSAGRPSPRSTPSLSCSPSGSPSPEVWGGQTRRQVTKLACRAGVTVEATRTGALTTFPPQRICPFYTEIQIYGFREDTSLFGFGLFSVNKTSLLHQCVILNISGILILNCRKPLFE